VGDPKKPLPEIARELNLDAVVEGSVLSSGGRVRITAQLIDAPADQHLWAKSYERNLTDVLLLQSEVARTIADEIRITLTPQEDLQLGGARRVNPEANDACLRGRYYWGKRTADDLKKLSSISSKHSKKTRGSRQPNRALHRTTASFPSTHAQRRTRFSPKLTRRCQRRWN
jgi:hypothetical protein